MGRKKKINRGPKASKVEEPEELKKAPHTFVLKKGKVGKDVVQLMLDTRSVMEPFTATNLKTEKHNSTKDFVGVAPLLHVTHMLMFSETDQASYLRLCRLPKGPTMTFRIDEFLDSSKVKSLQRRASSHKNLFQTAPLLVMNGFADVEAQEVKLMSSMWRNIFPSIDVNNINLNDLRRTVLLNYNDETKEIDFRHYAVKVKPVGLSRTVKKLVTARKIPDLGKFKDIHEAFERAGDGNATESEGEADEKDESRQVVISHSMKSRGNLVDEKSAVRLTEIGPRMGLSLVKIEEGLMDGAVLYHSYVKKSSEEAEALSEKVLKNRRLKDIRKREQEKNVEKKKILESSKSNRKSKKLQELHELSMKKAEGKTMKRKMPQKDNNLKSKKIRTGTKYANAKQKVGLRQRPS